MILYKNEKVIQLYECIHTMGNTLHIPSELCIKVNEELANDTYTVLRTSGIYDPGWRFGIGKFAENHGVKGPSASVRARTKPGTWYVFMDNGQDDPNVYACGWRRLETVYPTRLEGDEDAIYKWRTETTVYFNQEEEKRESA